MQDQIFAAAILLPAAVFLGLLILAVRIHREHGEILNLRDDRDEWKLRAETAEYWLWPLICGVCGKFRGVKDHGHVCPVPCEGYWYGVDRLSDRAKVLDAVHAERLRQDEKWGQQNHPDGTGSTEYKVMASVAKDAYEQAAKAGATTWALIHLEELYEALAETDQAKLYAELSQLSATCQAHMECILRRGQP